MASLTCSSWRVTGPAEEDIELDWDGYLAIPDQAARAYHLRIQQGYDNMAPGAG